MSAQIYAAMPQFGIAILFAVTFLSCLIVPLPASLVMLAAGAFVASGDLPVLPVLAAALGGAVLGDQIGFALGRWGGAPLWSRLERRPRAARLMQRARAGLADRAGLSVYLSRWLFAALGPWINLAAGATGIGWCRFTLAGLLGEATWVGLYVGTGIVFAAQMREVGQTMVSAIGAIGAGLVALWLGRLLWRRLRG